MLGLFSGWGVWYLVRKVKSVGLDWFSHFCRFLFPKNVPFSFKKVPFFLSEYSWSIRYYTPYIIFPTKAKHNIVRIWNRVILVHMRCSDENEMIWTKQILTIKLVTWPEYCIVFWCYAPLIPMCYQRIKRSIILKQNKYILRGTTSTSTGNISISNALIRNFFRDNVYGYTARLLEDEIQKKSCIFKIPVCWPCGICIVRGEARAMLFFKFTIRL